MSLVGKVYRNLFVPRVADYVALLAGRHNDFLQILVFEVLDRYEFGNFGVKVFVCDQFQLLGHHFVAEC